METRSLNILMDVARLQNFAKVARLHDVDPSSISRTIANLETELGIRLFQRSTRALTITEAGALYISRMQPLMQELEKAREDALNISNTPSGILKLTCSVAFGQACLLPLLAKFRTAYPDLKLNLHITDNNIDLVATQMDLAIRLAPSLDGGLIGTKLMQTRYRVVASPDYLKSHPPLTAPGALPDHSCLLFDLPDYRARWLFKNEKKQIQEINVKGDVTISSALAIKQAAMEGMGPALLANWMVDDEIKAGILVNVFPSHQATATTFDTGAWALYPSRAYLPHKVRITIDFLKANL